jgi:hypothetical protein
MLGNSSPYIQHKRLLKLVDSAHPCRGAIVGGCAPTLGSILPSRHGFVNGGHNSGQFHAFTPKTSEVLLEKDLKRDAKVEYRLRRRIFGTLEAFKTLSGSGDIVIKMTHIHTLIR